MTLKAVLFDFNGIIINDEQINRQVIEEILIEENLRSRPGEYRQVCRGRSSLGCLTELLTLAGRVVNGGYLAQLISRKTEAYQRQLEKLDKLPIYPGVEDLIYKLRVCKLKMGVVTTAGCLEVDLVLNRANLAQHFDALVLGDEVRGSKPEPDGYLMAVVRLNQVYPDLNLMASECLAIANTPARIQAAKRAGMQVVAVANIYPMHMLQRQANWTVDYLFDLELERVQEIYSRAPLQTNAGEC